jgi:hypothetical protein
MIKINSNNIINGLVWGIMAIVVGIIMLYIQYLYTAQFFKKDVVAFRPNIIILIFIFIIGFISSMNIKYE